MTCAVVTMSGFAALCGAAIVVGAAGRWLGTIIRNAWRSGP